jgi:tol-pal system protein YbgF
VRAHRLVVAALLAAVALGAHAQLFPDNEARKAIVELRAEGELQKKSIAELAGANRELLEQVSQLKRSLLDLNNQIEALRGDLARQRGANEQLARDVAELQRKQKDVAQAVDERVRKLEPQKVSVDGKEFFADNEEKRQYEEAFALLRGGDYGGAINGLNNFLRRWPASGYADSARFWIGNAHYGKRELREAIATFRAFIATAPDHPRVPEALLAIANSQSESKDRVGARATLGELLKKYPDSEAAQAGKERLAALK